MKKTLTIILSVAFIYCNNIIFETLNTRTYGDINGDGTVNIQDVILIVKMFFLGNMMLLQI